MKYTNQTAFDTVVKNLLKQNERSIQPDSNYCAYRGKNGLKCAIGWLIPDELYEERMENYIYLFYGGGFPKLKPFFDQVDILLLRALQDIHDRDEPKNWKEKFLKLAERYDLDISEVR